MHKKYYKALIDQIELYKWTQKNIYAPLSRPDGKLCSRAPARSLTTEFKASKPKGTKARVDLSEDIRSGLLFKYEVKADLAALAPPKLNKELVPALAPSVIKRDEYQARSQAQVGACLNAFGSGISILLKPEVLHDLNDEACSALSFLSEGMHLLADHHFRLSLARRALAKSSFNIIDKNAAEAATIDEFLFGQNFAETLKAAQTVRRPDARYPRRHLWWERRSFSPYASKPLNDVLRHQLLKRTSRETGELLLVHRRFANQEPLITGAVTLALDPGHDIIDK
ncbi:hypothetical protein RF55_13502 [Lasius niger]|uniref:Uncharacterized protein n=1 Tax=Lasius niger TaxID=67767 RepID=A0A0J7KAD9_LASNI|nr:hypothetical protein RF55_13502 [Lasius niger]